MKNKTKNLLTIILTAGFLFIGQFSAQAQEAKVPEGKSGMILIATVDIFSSKINSQNGNVFNISFDLHNEQKIQPQVIYGVELVKEKEEPLPIIKMGEKELGAMDQSAEYQIIVDQEIFSNDAVSLNAGETMHKEITYTAPSSLAGKYKLMLKARNSEGTILGVAPLGEVTLESSPNSLLIDESSCRIFINGDNSKEYRPQGGGIGVGPGSTLKMRCDIENKSSTSSQNVIPEMTTYYRSVFGKVVDNQKLEVIAVSPNGKSSKEFTLRVPEQAQNYEGIFVLTDEKGNKISNEVDLFFGVNGEHGMIENVLLDKDSYSAGEIAKLQVWYLVNGGSAEGGSVDILIKDGKGAACSQQLSEKQGAKQQSEYAIPITKDCQNPVAEVSIKNKDGKILAQNSFAVETKNGKANQEQNQSGLKERAIIAVGIILILALLGLLAFLFSKRKGLIVFLGLIFAVGLFFANQASANTYTSTVFKYQVVQGFYDMPNYQPYYNEEQTMHFSSTIYFQWPASELHGVTDWTLYHNDYFDTSAYYQPEWPVANFEGYSVNLIGIYYYNYSGGSSVTKTISPPAPACRLDSKTGPLCPYSKKPREGWHQYGTAGTCIPDEYTPDCFYPYPSKIGGFFTMLGMFDYYPTYGGESVDDGNGVYDFAHSPFQVKNPICGCSSGTCDTAGSCPTLSPINYQPTPSCSFGTPSSLSWNSTTSSYCWTCYGQDYTAGSPLCCVPRIINGSCGTASGATFTSVPTANLCASGTPTAISGTGIPVSNPWRWGCNGINGGTSTSSTACSATLTPINGVCGSAQRTFLSTATTWGGYTFCSAGNPSPASPVFPATPGTSVSWTCTGLYGGTNAPCTAVRSGTSLTYTLEIVAGRETIVTSSDGKINCKDGVDIGTGACRVSYPSGTTVILNGSAGIPSYTFDSNSWTIGCESPSGSNCTVIMNANKTIGAEAICSEEDSTCASSKCTTETCSDSCGNVYPGTMDCSNSTGTGTGTWKEVSP